MANTATIAWMKFVSAAIANPNSFGYFRRGEPFKGFKAKVDNTSFDYFRRGQPLNNLVKKP